MQILSAIEMRKSPKRCGKRANNAIEITENEEKAKVSLQNTQNISDEENEFN